VLFLNKTIKEISARVKELRELSDFTTKEMANMCNISEEEYIKYENAEKDIPASVLYEIAHKFKVDMGLLLTGEETRMDVFTVTRKDQGVIIQRRKQYKYENLVEKFINKKGEIFIVTVEPKDIDKPETNNHPGQEFNYILEGSVRLYINENEIVLNEGDSIFFDSHHEHAMKALNNKPAKFLAILM